MKFKKIIESLSHDEERVFSQIITELKKTKWDGLKEMDETWGWIILADKSPLNFGVILKRIKPFQIKKEEDWERARKLQESLRRELIEIHPYKLTRNENGTRKIYLYNPLFSL